MTIEKRERKINFLVSSSEKFEPKMANFSTFFKDRAGKTKFYKLFAKYIR